MQKKVITICDECGKIISSKRELIKVLKNGLIKLAVGGIYTRFTKDFCSVECTVNHLKKDWIKSDN